MLFTGDVALVDEDRFDFIGFPENLRSIPMCINLEGAIKSADISLKKGIYNTVNGLESFCDFNLAVPFLANNHIHDLYGGITKTHRYFESKNLQAIGAGITLKDAQDPGLVEANSVHYAVLGFGWPVIGCVPCSKTKPGVNEFNRQNVLTQVQAAQSNDRNKRLVVVVHGNYEFEPYPQPGHRRLAKELIDLGVYAVIFHHPHIVGPIERYKGRTIAYSLGNFAFSYGKFFDGNLVFPERSFHQLVIELGDEDVVHHCNFIPPSAVEYSGSEKILSERLSLKAEFEGFSDEKYLVWFKRNRHKKTLLPIYTSADKSFENFVKDKLVYIRQRCIYLAVRFGFKTLKRQ